MEKSPGKYDFGDLDFTAKLAREHSRLPNSDKFKAFLASLGYFDREGHPRPGWAVFESEAGMLSHPAESAKAR